MRVLVVGGALLDVVVRPSAEARADTSNEAQVRVGAGGAARNVAENLVRLGAQAVLVADWADDPPGRLLAAQLGRPGLQVVRAAGRRTGFYVALLHADGALDRGYVATGTEDVTAAEYLRALPEPASFDGAVLDANLSAAALEAVGAHLRAAGVPYALQTVAAGRARHALGAVAGCALVKPNRQEAAALTGLPCETASDAERCARALRAAGARAVLLSRGPEGFYFESDALTRHCAVLPGPVVDVTGAGDALLAAVFLGLLRGLPAERALEAGRRAAALACASAGAASAALDPSVFEPPAR